MGCTDIGKKISNFIKKCRKANIHRCCALTSMCVGIIVTPVETCKFQRVDFTFTRNNNKKNKPHQKNQLFNYKSYGKSMSRYKQRQPHPKMKTTSSKNEDDLTNQIKIK